MSEQDRHAGKPGKPGQPGTTRQGGTGGEGGVGGEGGEIGGAGGAGGTGGQMGPMGPRGRRGLPSVWGLVGYCILTAAVVFALWQVQGVASRGEEAHVAVCALRTDLERRVQASRKFLRENPEGIPGIPAATIQQGIDNQQKTIDVLGVLDC
jgi:hypothetical protein